MAGAIAAGVSAWCIVIATLVLHYRRHRLRKMPLPLARTTTVEIELEEGTCNPSVSLQRRPPILPPVELGVEEETSPRLPVANSEENVGYTVVDDKADLSDDDRYICSPTPELSALSKKPSVTRAHLLALASQGRDSSLGDELRMARSSVAVALTTPVQSVESETMLMLGGGNKREDASENRASRGPDPDPSYVPMRESMENITPRSTSQASLAQRFSHGMEIPSQTLAKEEETAGADEPTISSRDSETHQVFLRATQDGSRKDRSNQKCNDSTESLKKNGLQIPSAILKLSTGTDAYVDMNKSPRPSTATAASQRKKWLFPRLEGDHEALFADKDSVEKEGDFCGSEALRTVGDASGEPSEDTRTLKKRPVKKPRPRNTLRKRPSMPIPEKEAMQEGGVTRAMKPPLPTRPSTNELIAALEQQNHSVENASYASCSQSDCPPPSQYEGISESPPSRLSCPKTPLTRTLPPSKLNSVNSENDFSPMLHSTPPSVKKLQANYGSAVLVKTSVMETPKKGQTPIKDDRHTSESSKRSSMSAAAKKLAKRQDSYADPWDSRLQEDVGYEQVGFTQAEQIEFEWEGEDTDEYDVVGDCLMTGIDVRRQSVSSKTSEHDQTNDHFRSRSSSIIARSDGGSLVSYNRSDSDNGRASGKNVSFRTIDGVNKESPQPAHLSVDRPVISSGSSPSAKDRSESIYDRPSVSKIKPKPVAKKPLSSTTSIPLDNPVLPVKKKLNRACVSLFQDEDRPNVSLEAHRSIASKWKAAAQGTKGPSSLDSKPATSESRGSSHIRSAAADLVKRLPIVPLPIHTSRSAADELHPLAGQGAAQHQYSVYKESPTTLENHEPQANVSPSDFDDDLYDEPEGVAIPREEIVSSKRHPPAKVTDSCESSYSLYFTSPAKTTAKDGWQIDLSKVSTPACRRATRRHCASCVEKHGVNGFPATTLHKTVLRVSWRREIEKDRPF